MCKYKILFETANGSLYQL